MRSSEGLGASGGGSRLWQDGERSDAASSTRARIGPYAIIRAQRGRSSMKDIVTADDVRAVAPGGEVATSAGAIVTPWAREVAATRGVRIVPGAGAANTIALGADHGGFSLKEEIKAHLGRLGQRFHDYGTFSTEPV